MIASLDPALRQRLIDAAIDLINPEFRSTTMTLDFDKIKNVAAQHALALTEEFGEPEEAYAAAIVIVRSLQYAMRKDVGIDEEIEVASQAYLFMNRMEAENAAEANR